MISIQPCKTQQITNEMCCCICIQGSKSRPKVIMDLCGCSWWLYAKLDMICGGQGKLYKKRWEVFFAAFESAGIELVLVADGHNQDSIHLKWVRRQYNLLEKVITPVFDSLVIN